jgi:hypothetical protein
MERPDIRDVPLEFVYQYIQDQFGPRKTPFRELPKDEQREYKRLKKREQRARDKEREQSGEPRISADNLKQAVFEAAAMMIIANHPAAEDLKRIVFRCFPQAPGLTMTIKDRLGSQQIKRKFLTRETLERWKSEERGEAA